MTKIQPPSQTKRLFLLLVCCLAGSLFQLAVLAQPAFPGDSLDSLVVTNMAELVRLAGTNSTVPWQVHFVGTVLWVSPDRDRLIVQDASAGLELKIGFHDQPEVSPGERVSIEGTCRLKNGNRVFGAVVDNDGIHGSTEKSGTVYLSAGLHPITLEWFNNYLSFDLAAEFAGPGQQRESIPSSRLFRDDPGSLDGKTRFAPGLDYRCYEGEWNWLPDFTRLAAVKSGVVTHFTLQPRTRDTNVALVFTGYFAAEQSGDYTFWTRSDDGSELYIGSPLRLTPLGRTGLPEAQPFIQEPFSSARLEMRWIEVEGTVVRVGEDSEGVNTELIIGNGSVCLKTPSGSYESMRKLIRARIKVKGIYQAARSVDGQVIPSMLVPELTAISLMKLESLAGEGLGFQSLRTFATNKSTAKTVDLVMTGGTVISNLADGRVVLEENGARILAEAAGISNRIGVRVKVVGWLSQDGATPLLKGCVIGTDAGRANDAVAGLPLLTEAIQVKRLSQSEAQRGYPVKIRGVVTAIVGDDFIIQDGTWSIFCYGEELKSDSLPQAGEVWQIEGTSGAHFAPDINVLSAEYIGPGLFPEPIQPTKDELINGSLDTQFIEVQGVITAAGGGKVTLLTREGELVFQGLDDLGLDRFEDALIRLRGVFIPNRDTNLMLLPSSPVFQLFNASASLDEPAPAEPFELPLKRISDLLHFDARADALRRIKISGQVLYGRQGEYFLSDGAAGARFQLKQPADIKLGNLVQVVGFPDLSGPSLVLREAEARVSAQAGLPPGIPLSSSNLLNGQLDAMMVSIQSRLIGINRNRSETTLDLQTGARSFVAVLANHDGVLPEIEPGSLLQLTGVYDIEGGSRLVPNQINSFVLLLDSPAGVHVLERPSWWTARHALIVVGGMLLVILGAMVWITALRRQVEERTQQLSLEIKGREHAEYQRALEAERTRIARDLHDELGATLTEIRFLGAVKSRDPSTLDEMSRHLREVSEKSRHMVSSLDEIVWAVNPANDSLPNLANYLCHVAEEFFRTTDIRCRLDVEDLLPPLTLTSELRHSLYLVVREALNNVAKHSQATEVWLRIHYRDRQLLISIEDNGVGFEGGDPKRTGNGLLNMRSRMAKVGGHFECGVSPGKGALCQIRLPLI